MLKFGQSLTPTNTDFDATAVGANAINQTNSNRNS